MTYSEITQMRYVLIILALLGIAASSLALREHYRTYGDAPCDINDRWDCGIVNHSPYAMFHGIPVADIGIAGYLLLGILALKRMYKTMLVLAVPALAFSLYLAHIEKDVLGVWCLYCAISLGVISLMTLLLVITMTTQFIRQPKS
ncbi:MAG: vitamin K epoxide reductase family protein [Terriglobales bacterium]